MLLWLIFAALAGGVLLLVARVAATRPGMDDQAFAASVYRDQLDELDRDEARGLICSRRGATRPATRWRAGSSPHREAGRCCLPRPRMIAASLLGSARSRPARRAGRLSCPRQPGSSRRAACRAHRPRPSPTATPSADRQGRGASRRQSARRRRMARHRPRLSLARALCRCGEGLPQRPAHSMVPMPCCSPTTARCSSS